MIYILIVLAVDAYGQGNAALKIAQRLQSDLLTAGKTSSLKS